MKFDDNIYQVSPGAGSVEERISHSRVCVFQVSQLNTKYHFTMVSVSVKLGLIASHVGIQQMTQFLSTVCVNVM